MPRPLRLRDLDREDTAQTVRMARVQAKRRYSPDLGMPWPVFLDQTIMNAIRAEKRMRKRAKPRGARLVCLDRVRESLEARRSREDFGEAVILFEAAARAMKTLTQTQRRVVLLMFHLEMSREEAAAVLGKSPEAVGEARDKALERMRTVPLPDPSAG